MSYIPKQVKRERERVEAKLDREIVQKLELYCRYLESDRDYVIGKALEIALNKDKGFADWLKSQPQVLTGDLPEERPDASEKRRR
jgi:bacterioferritin (cytochrome b1)